MSRGGSQNNKPIIFIPAADAVRYGTPGADLNSQQLYESDRNLAREEIMRLQRVQRGEEEPLPGDQAFKKLLDSAIEKGQINN